MSASITQDIVSAVVDTDFSRAERKNHRSSGFVNMVISVLLASVISIQFKRRARSSLLVADRGKRYPLIAVKYSVHSAIAELCREKDRDRGLAMFKLTKANKIRSTSSRVPGYGSRSNMHLPMVNSATDPLEKNA